MWMHAWEWPGAQVPWVLVAIGHVVWWLFVLGSIAALVWWVRRLAHRGERFGASGRAIEVLAERYARGEITQEEFEQRRRVLSA